MYIKDELISGIRIVRTGCIYSSASGILKLQYEMEEVVIDDRIVDFNGKCWIRYLY